MLSSKAICFGADSSTESSDIKEMVLTSVLTEAAKHAHRTAHSLSQADLLQVHLSVLLKPSVLMPSATRIQNEPCHWNAHAQGGKDG